MSFIQLVTDRGPCSYCSVALSFLQSLLQNPEFPPVTAHEPTVTGDWHWVSSKLLLLQILLLGLEFPSISAREPWVSSHWLEAPSFLPLLLKGPEVSSTPPITTPGPGYSRFTDWRPKFPSVNFRRPCVSFNLLLVGPEFSPPWSLSFLQLLFLGPECSPISVRGPWPWVSPKYCSQALSFLQLLLIGPEFPPVTAHWPWVSSSYWSLTMSFLKLLLIGPEFPPVTAHWPWVSSSYGS